jgi:hypothetical protein
MKFRQAVNETPDLSGAWQAGLQALKEIDRNRVNAVESRRLKGSVDVESRLQALHPGERQWDYAVGFDPAGFQGEVIYWIEVHPANDGEINVMLEKLQFLRRWLREHGQSLDSLPRAFIWVSSGKTSFTLTAPQQKRFALLGLQHAGRYFKIPEKFVT